MLFKKSQIKKRIFEILKQARESRSHHGLLIAFSDMANILAKGAYPIGTKKKEFEEVCSIFSPEAEEFIKNFKEDGAVLIDKKGNLYKPPVYLNVNILGLDENQIHPEFGSRHIAALACSSNTKACIYVLSEETNKIREFIKGEVKRQFPKEKFDIKPEKIQEQLIKEEIKKRIVSTTKFKNFIVHRILRVSRK